MVFFLLKKWVVLFFRRLGFFLIEGYVGSGPPQQIMPPQPLQVGPTGQISYQFVINSSLVRIAKNLPYTCEILRLK
jgi:hypothetical protein